ITRSSVSYICITNSPESGAIYCFIILGTRDIFSAHTITKTANRSNPINNRCLLTQATLRLAPQAAPLQRAQLPPQSTPSSSPSRMPLQQCAGLKIVFLVSDEL